MTPDTLNRVVKGLLQGIADAETAGNADTAEQLRCSLRHMLAMLGHDKSMDDLH